MQTQLLSHIFAGQNLEEGSFANVLVLLRAGNSPALFSEFW